MRSLTVYKPSQVKKTVEALVENQPPITFMTIDISNELSRENKPLVRELMLAMKENFNGMAKLFFSSSFRNELPCDEFIELLADSR